MTTLIHRSEAREILEACEISGFWPSPYSAGCEAVPFVTLAERFLLLPECLGILLAGREADEEDYFALRALAWCKDYYWQEDGRDQKRIDSSFELLREWVAEETTSRLLAKFSSATPGE